MADHEPNTKCCATCRFGKEFDPEDPDDTDVVCRRFPPATGYPRFPIVPADEWCGEHKPIQDKGIEIHIDSSGTGLDDDIAAPAVRRVLPAVRR